MSDPEPNLSDSEPVSDPEPNLSDFEPDNPTLLLGRSSLSNLGNSCYLNTALQSLFHIMPFSQAVIEIGERLLNAYQVALMDESNDEFDPEFVEAYLNLLKAFWEENSAISPVTFHRVFTERFPNYLPYSQNDSSESLLYIIDHLHESLARPLKVHPNLQTWRGISRLEFRQILAERQWYQYFKYKTSPVLDYLTGQEHHRLQCLNCQNISHKFVAFNHLPLSLTSHRSSNKNDASTKKPKVNQLVGTELYTLLDRYCAKEQLDDQNQWECDGCGAKTQAYRKTTFRKLPKYLIMVLKRFNQQMDGRVTKKNTWVNYPLVNLDLNRYITVSDEKQPNYDLVSVGCHRGITDYGHYYNYSQTPDGYFYLFNDEVVELVREYSEVISRDAYFLVYEQQSAESSK